MLANEHASPSAASLGTMRRFGSYSDTASPMLEWYLAQKTGPSFQKWPHYFDAYERHLTRYRNRSLTFLEIGIDKGGSLRMWRWWFGPHARIFGADIKPDKQTFARDPYYGSPERIFIGDQQGDSFWGQVGRQFAPETVDVIIDDGGHTVGQQMRTLNESLKLLAPGGTYICEDIHGGANAFARHVHERFVAVPANARTTAVKVDHKNRRVNRDVAETLNQFNHPQSLEAPNAHQRALFGVSFYPYMVVIEKLYHPRRTMSGFIFQGQRYVRANASAPQHHDSTAPSGLLHQRHDHY